VLAVASGRLPADPLADAVHTTPDSGLPPTPVAADVDDVRAMLVPALRHRIVLSYRAEADGVRDVDVLRAVEKSLR
jgi:hypothetical protein